MNHLHPPQSQTNRIRPVFLIGHPRSGTTWLMWLLAQHPEVVSCNHAGFFHALQPLHSWWKTRTPFAKTIHVFERAEADQVEAAYSQVKLTDHLDMNGFSDLARPLAESVFEAIAAAKPGASVAVEQTPENAVFFDWIHPILPDAYFLHIYRDPRAVAASMRQAVRDWADPDDFPSHPVQIARSWNRYMEIGNKIREQTDRYRSVSYEQLRSRNTSVLGEIFLWLGLPSDETTCARYFEASTIGRMKKKNRMPNGFFRRGKSTGWEHDLTPAQVRTIEFVSKGWMDTLGYTPRYRVPANPPLMVRWHEFAGGLRAKGGPGLRRRIRRTLDRIPVIRSLLRWAIRLRRTIRGMAE